MKMSRVESAARIALEFNRAFNRHDVAGMVRLMTDDCVYEHFGPAPDGTACSGKEAVARFWEEFFHASPHAHMEVEEVFGFGFRCLMRWRYHWVDAAGEKRHVRGVDIFKVKEGSICEHLSYVKG